MPVEPVYILGVGMTPFGRHPAQSVRDQRRGEAGAPQVQGARIALAENGGGLMGVEEAAVAITILEKAS